MCRKGIDQCPPCGKQILRPTQWTHFVNEGPTEMNCGTCDSSRLSALSLVIINGRQQRPQELVLNHFFDDFPDKEAGKVECPLLCLLIQHTIKKTQILNRGGVIGFAKIIVQLTMVGIAFAERLCRYSSVFESRRHTVGLSIGVGVA